MLIAVIVITVVLLYKHEDINSQVEESNLPFANFGLVVLERKNESDPSSYGKRCGPPSLDAFNKDILPFYSQSKSVDCPGEFNKKSPFLGTAFTIRNGHHLHQLVDMGLSCCYQPFFRVGDDKVRHSNCLPIQDNVTVISTGIHYIEVICKNNDEVQLYRDAFPLVQNVTEKTPTNYSQMATSKLGRLNIVIIGLDAASGLNFKRQMPLSRNYLLNSLAATSLEGYAVTGSGSRANLIPMLTGLSYATFSNTCAKDGHLDECPFIWKQFARIGYLTSNADDWTNFNDHWPNAFKNPPTDYYLRPYTAYMEKFAPKTWARKFDPLHYCFGTRLAFEVVLNFVQSVREVAENVNRPYFQFTWTGRLVHDYLNSLGLGDVPLLQTLTSFKESGALNNTIILVLGDHGNNLGKQYDTAVGRLEYRLPAAYIVLPPWFSTRFPEEYRNLQDNSKKLTTSFDIFKTLHHLMDFEQQTGHGSNGYRDGHGISLFKPIPDNRKCLEAGISLKWCNLCHPTTPLKLDDPLVEVATKLVVESVNNLSSNNRNVCHEQTLKEVKSAEKWNPKDVFMELCNVHGEFSAAHDEENLSTIHLNISCDRTDQVDIVNVQLLTNPSRAVYNGQVMMIATKDGVTNVHLNNMMFTDNVQRIDRYAEKSYCVSSGKIKPYCLCK